MVVLRSLERSVPQNPATESNQRHFYFAHPSLRHLLRASHVVLWDRFRRLPLRISHGRLRSRPLSATVSLFKVRPRERQILETHPRFDVAHLHVITAVVVAALRLMCHQRSCLVAVDAHEHGRWHLLRSLLRWRLLYLFHDLLNRMLLLRAIHILLHRHLVILLGQYVLLQVSEVTGAHALKLCKR